MSHTRAPWHYEESSTTEKGKHAMLTPENDKLERFLAWCLTVAGLFLLSMVMRHYYLQGYYDYLN